MGKYTNGRMPKEIEVILYESDVPEWYVESMKKIRYLCFKTQLVEWVKRDIGKFLALNK